MKTNPYHPQLDCDLYMAYELKKAHHTGRIDGLREAAHYAYQLGSMPLDTTIQKWLLKYVDNIEQEP
jgi:hypothetical protein